MQSEKLAALCHYHSKVLQLIFLFFFLFFVLSLIDSLSLNRVCSKAKVSHVGNDFCM